MVQKDSQITRKARQHLQGSVGSHSSASSVAASLLLEELVCRVLVASDLHVGDVDILKWNRLAHAGERRAACGATSRDEHGGEDQTHQHDASYDSQRDESGRGVGTFEEWLHKSLSLNTNGHKCRSYRVVM